MDLVERDEPRGRDLGDAKVSLRRFEGSSLGIRRLAEGGDGKLTGCGSRSFL